MTIFTKTTCVYEPLTNIHNIITRIVLLNYNLSLNNCALPLVSSATRIGDHTSEGTCTQEKNVCKNKKTPQKEKKNENNCSQI